MLFALFVLLIFFVGDIINTITSVLVKKRLTPADFSQAESGASQKGAVRTVKTGGKGYEQKMV